MIICVCHGISDRTLRSAIRQGCNSTRDLIRATGAGTSCGSCACDLKRMVRENHANHTSTGGSAPLTALLR